MAIAQYLRFGSDVTWRPYQHTYVFLFSVVFAAGWLIVLSAFRTRSPRIIGTGIEEYRRVVSASLWIFGAIAIISLLLKADVARGYLAVALPGGTLGLVEAIRQLTGQTLGAKVENARHALVSGYGMINYDRGLCSGAAILAAT